MAHSLAPEMMKPKQKPRYLTHGISWPDADLLQQAKDRADSLGLSLSDYINRLVLEDVQKGGPMTLPVRETNKRRHA